MTGSLLLDETAADRSDLERHILRLVELVECDAAAMKALTPREKAAVALVLNTPALLPVHSILAAVSLLPPDWLAAAIALDRAG